MAAVIPQINVEDVLQVLEVSAKNTWYYAKKLTSSTFSLGVQACEKTGEYLSGLYTSAIKKYFEMTEERGKGIVVVKESDNGDLIVRVIYKMNTTNSNNIVPFKTILPVLSHAIGLDTLYRSAPIESTAAAAAVTDDDDNDGGRESLPKVVGSGLSFVEVVEDFVSDAESERYHQKLFNGSTEPKNCLGESLKVGTKLNKEDDDGSYLVIVLSKDRDEEEQIKDIEKSIVECKCNVTVIKKSSIHKANTKTFREGSSSPVNIMDLEKQYEISDVCEKTVFAENGGGDGDGDYANGNDDDDDDDDTVSFRIDDTDSGY